ncbi:hypothetical protein TNCV_58491 [Trichonephila clavipes]|nr:hypothetical protein TNCV_58491 [Trichonephila clavipes]
MRGFLACEREGEKIYSIRVRLLLKIEIMSASSSFVNPTPLAHANNQGDEHHPRLGALTSSGGVDKIRL